MIYARPRVPCAKSALYGTERTPENPMCKKCSIRHRTHARESHVQKVLYTAQNARPRVPCAKSALYGTERTPESPMCKKCSIRHRTHAREFHVQKVLYTAQNARPRVPCAKSALYSTKRTKMFSYYHAPKTARLVCSKIILWPTKGDYLPFMCITHFNTYTKFSYILAPSIN